MEGYEARTYGDRIAERYDERHAEIDPADSVETLARLAGEGGRVLELAIGTGRIALPLAERGVEVYGVDASEAMVAKLRAKPGGERIPVTIGDFADVDVEGRFRVIFVAFNTFFALTSQEAQLKCFANAAAHLDEDGVFVLDVFVPDPTRYDRNQRVSAMNVELDAVDLETTRYDPVEQVMTTHHMRLSPSGIELYPIVGRFAWPAELDLMARLAGLRLHERWGGWDGAPFTADSRMHVSVYGR